MQFQLNLYFISIFEILKKTENKNDFEKFKRKDQQTGQDYFSKRNQLN